MLWLNYELVVNEFHKWTSVTVYSRYAIWLALTELYNVWTKKKLSRNRSKIVLSKLLSLCACSPKNATRSTDNIYYKRPMYQFNDIWSPITNSYTNVFSLNDISSWWYGCGYSHNYQFLKRITFSFFLLQECKLPSLHDLLQRRDDKGQRHRPRTLPVVDMQKRETNIANLLKKLQDL